MVRPTVRIADFVAHAVGAEHRVEWRVDGVPVWFTSEDAELRATPDAAMASFLLPAAGRGADLVLSGALDARLVDAVPAIAALALEWWGLEVNRPQAPTISVPGERRDGTALFFTGGVDSFHVLLERVRPPEVLVTVVGFDIPLDDEVRARDLLTHMREVAGTVGSRLVVVRTNLRQVPLFEELGWPRTHGGALAAVAHLLGGSVGTVLVASSYPEPWPAGWGSHWRMDEHWSSTSVTLEHVGGRATRLDKIRAIGGHPLVRDHLQVCWKRHTPVGNCGRCPKCLATALFFELAGHGSGRRQIPVVEDMASQLAGLDRTPFVTAYAQLLEEGILPADLVPVVQGLLFRCGHLDEQGEVRPGSPLACGRPWGLT